MDVVIHDFAGHPFPAQLARRLARNGHRVHHLYCASLVGARGDLSRREDDPGRLSIAGLGTGRPLAKADLVRRFLDERRYGRLAAGRIARLAPDVVLCANTPLDAVAAIQEACRKRGIGFVHWLQDLDGLAAAAILPRKVPLLGAALARRFLALEGRLLRRADHVIPVSDDFGGHLRRIGIAPDGCTTIENWAPLEEIPVRPRRNGWARRHGLDTGRNVLYSGNLGFKHDPALLTGLARAMCAASPRDRLVVVSEGIGAEWLARRKAEHRLPNLVLLPFQPWTDVPDMMASADVLVALLEPQDRPWCVPSKVLSYCCAGRAIVLSADAGNLASRTVERARCGRVVGAGDAPAFTRAVLELLADEDRRGTLGENARRHAEAAFDAAAIAARFEAVLARVARGSSARRARMKPDSS